MMDEEHPLRSQIDGGDASLARNMFALRNGLETIAGTYRDHVFVADEDPDAFGAGHMVLYPTSHTHARLAIEEQYAPGTDSEDVDRLPTSWLWRAEHLARGSDGTYSWRVTGFGEVDSDDVARLLVIADRWAQHTREAARRDEAIHHGVSTAHPAPPDVPGL